jgi:ankyrin repeat protein
MATLRIPRSSAPGRLINLLTIITVLCCACAAKNGAPVFQKEPAAQEGPVPLKQLYIAIMRNNIKEVEQLMAEDIGLNHVMSYPLYGDYREKTPLSLAIELGSIPIVQLLIDNGADVDLTDDYLFSRNETPLTAAIKKDERIAMMLINAHAGVNKEMYSGITPLGCAAREGSIQLVQTLLSLGAEVKNTKGFPVLSYAAAGSAAKVSPEILSLLIDAGADVNGRSWKGKTALMEAAYAGSMKSFQALMAAGADIALKDDDGFTALHHAIDGHERYDGPYREIIRALLDSGAGQSISTGLYFFNDGMQVWCSGGVSPLMMSRGFMTDDLIACGADVNAQNEDGLTALMINCFFGNRQTVETLIAKGAKLNARNNRGRTALFYTHDDEITKLLIDKGADINIEDNMGLTPLAAGYILMEKLDPLLKSLGAKLGSTDEQRIKEIRETGYDDYLSGFFITLSGDR